MADVTIKAAYASVVEDDEEGNLFIAFVEDEDEDSPYILFRRALAGGEIWFEMTDEAFGAFDAVESIARLDDGLLITVRDAARARLGWVTTIQVIFAPDCADLEIALTSLQEDMGLINNKWPAIC